MHRSFGESNEIGSCADDNILGVIRSSNVGAGGVVVDISSAIHIGSGVYILNVCSGTCVCSGDGSTTFIYN